MDPLEDEDPEKPYQTYEHWLISMAAIPVAFVLLLLLLHAIGVK